MARLTGAFVSLLYERTDTFDWADPKTGVVKPIRNFVGLMSHGDGCVTREQISFPRDPQYQAPQLTAGVQMLFPVIATVNKSKQKIQYTIRTDMPPVPAPEFA